MSELKEIIGEDEYDKHLLNLNGGMFYGIPVSDLSKEDLVVCASLGWRSYTKELKRERLI